MPGKIKSKMIWDREGLENLYHKQGMSLTDIAQKYGCSRQYVQLVFKELNIERRTRQEALRQKPRNRKSKYDFKPFHDSFIEKNYTKMTDHEIADKLKKPPSSVTYRRLLVLGKKKVNRRNFTSEENDFILDNYKNLTDLSIAEKLNRSLISVTHHRNRILGRPKRNIRSYSETENVYIKQNYRKLTDGQLADALNRSKASIAIHRNEVLGLGKMKRRQPR